MADQQTRSAMYCGVIGVEQLGGGGHAQFDDFLEEVTRDA